MAWWAHKTATDTLKRTTISPNTRPVALSNLFLQELLDYAYITCMCAPHVINREFAAVEMHPYLIAFHDRIFFENIINCARRKYRPNFRVALFYLSLRNRDKFGRAECLYPAKMHGLIRNRWYFQICKCGAKRMGCFFYYITVHIVLLVMPCFWHYHSHHFIHIQNNLDYVSHIDTLL